MKALSSDFERVDGRSARPHPHPAQVRAGKRKSHQRPAPHFAPGLRVYTGKSEIPRVLGGLGLVIISTPQGIMSGKRAKKVGVGGEVMAYVW